LGESAAALLLIEALLLRQGGATQESGLEMRE
jgi:hypothetical protein